MLVRQRREWHPAPAKRTRQSKAGNLFTRLETFDACFLVFLTDPVVPFTNNQGEQDLRMMKTRQKISGGFRTLKGPDLCPGFGRIRGYLSLAENMALFFGLRSKTR